MADETRREMRVEVPAPTPWPMIAALGVTLGFAGLVTHGVVSLVGSLLLAAGAIGWFREVLPRQHVEEVAVEPRAAAPPEPRRVLRLEVGELRHRVRYPEEVYPYSAGIRGGLAGAVVMAALACLYGLLFHGSVWYPINLLAASASARLAAATPAELATFSSEGLLLAVLIHAVMSGLVGLLYGILLPMFPWHPLISGGAVAPLVWTGLLWAVLRTIDAGLAARIDWTWFALSQVAFGVAAGLVVVRARKVATLQHVPFAVRAGIEATGMPGDEAEGE